MKKTLLALAFLPISASAEDCDISCQIFRQSLGLPAVTAAPSYGLPVQPVLPVPQDNGPWGTGYSVVTTTRPTQNLFNRDLTGSETVQRVVPNDGLGQPMRGLDLGWGR